MLSDGDGAGVAVVAWTAGAENSRAANIAATAASIPRYLVSADVLSKFENLHAKAVRTEEIGT
ncbi:MULTISPECIES: hypothetical protein [Arthrobacter]|uniref:hypothetical protein n=1 Tax=Arthrobacter TaxID=1663 RepID=UPI001F3D9FAE|nr:MULTISPECIES: hypothetical protein [Arthrobacter]